MGTKRAKVDAPKRGSKPKRPKTKQERLQRKEQSKNELKELQKRIEAEAPPPTNIPLEELTKRLETYQAHVGTAKEFSELPISKQTLEGLQTAPWTEMTKIQRAAIPHALAGRDVLGAARTGSGKTLAFLVPVVEALYRENWNIRDGCGALIISPVRELAMQTFDVLRAVASKHQFSAGLIIGGRSFEEEQKYIGRMNIIVCTPGRLLQHLDETEGFTCDGLRVLVLDEADRCLDMGFEKALNAIIEHLPPRQTLLFSATQTTSVSTLARLSLNQPEYVSVHEHSDIRTPGKLAQTTITVPLDEKLSALFAFVKSHLSSKIIVFFSSCKQVRFVYEVFCRLRPGLPVACLHGRQKQLARMGVFMDFQAKEKALLLATDLAARGLDFTGVDWVVQVDCPIDVATYIHRVGRTARYTSKGQALLFLLPSEAAMLEKLHAARIPLEQKTAREHPTVTGRLQSFVAESVDIKYLAQRAFISYMRSVFLASDKEVFDVTQLPAVEFAASLGLPSTPNLKFGKALKANKNLPYGMRGEDEDSGEEKQKEDRMGRLFHRKNVGVLHPTHTILREEDQSESDDELLTVKRRLNYEPAPGTKRPAAALEEAEHVVAQNQQFIALLQADQEVADQADKLTHKKRLKAKRDARKAKERAEKAALNGGFEARLPSDNEASSDESGGQGAEKTRDQEEEAGEEEIKRPAKRKKGRRERARDKKELQEKLAKLEEAAQSSSEEKKEKRKSKLPDADLEALALKMLQDRLG